MEDDRRSLTYANFVSAVSRLAAAIRAVESEPGRIGILLPTGLEYAVAVYASLAAGRQCVLMDAAYPAARNDYIAQQARIVLMLVDSQSQPSAEMRILDVQRAMNGHDAAILRSDTQIGIDAPAFVLCTSGSSGLPKAIVHSQRTMLHWARTVHDALHVRASDHVLSLSSFSTLGGFTALLGFPLAGASMQMIDIKAIGLAGLLNVLVNRPVTILRAAPSMLRTLCQLPQARQALARLRIVQTYGEPLLKADLCNLSSILPAQCFVRSTYGSTEASGFSWFAGQPDDYDPLRVAAGALMPDTLAMIIDDNGDPCPAGVPGELLIRSPYNALGELRNGEFINGRLQPDPSHDGSRIYRTGDIARFHADGIFVVLGRKDRMTKINGQRIEPSEIEAALMRCPGVKQAEVVVEQKTTGPRLMAFVVPLQDTAAGSVAMLRAALRSSLPSFMMPSRIFFVDSIPLLPGGKVDVCALLARGNRPSEQAPA